jgi:hypothetical protein
MFLDSIMGLQACAYGFNGKAVIEDGLVIEITSRMRRLGNGVEITKVTVLDVAEVSC